ncbi:Aspartate/glutamate/uridylate kinase [Paraphysoderma sedebokerense]|nr:Aspartate/glutamate/uridylate kinase [Paraphysoderma sedebokerense]
MSSSVDNPKPGSPKTKSYTIVIKIGTTSICDEATHYPLLSNLSLLVETVVKLKDAGHKVVLVTSGAIGVGMRRMKLTTRPKKLAQVQAIAGIGQSRLMALYDSLFAEFNQPIAQVLLSRGDISDRSHYLNAVNTFREMLDYNVLPIVNENDAVSVTEIKFGDNDTLSAIVAGMVNANYLFLLTDVECLYTDNPRLNKDAKPVRIVEDIEKLKEQITITTAGSSLGTGGMTTKLIAAELATSAGCHTVILKSTQPTNILKVINPVEAEDQVGTIFLARESRLGDRRWWILHGLKPHGTIVIDAGATKALLSHASLFAAGIVSVAGSFTALQSVRLVSSFKLPSTSNEGEVEVRQIEIGKGIANYSSVEIELVKGCGSKEVQEKLGYMDQESIVSRENVVLSVGGSSEKEVQMLIERVEKEGLWQLQRENKN